MDNIFFDVSRLKHLGRGAIIGKTVRIRHPEKVVIGDHTIIDDFTYISCELETGDGCHIGPNVTLVGAARITLGHFVGVSAGSAIYSSSSDYAQATLDMPSVPPELKFGGECAPTALAHFALLGAHSVVLPGARLPTGFASAAGMLVRRKAYEPWSLYGADGRLLTRRDHEELRARLQHTKYAVLVDG